MQKGEGDNRNFIRKAIDSYSRSESFGDMVRSTITSLMMKAVVPWIDECFAKYDEYSFHVKMSEGFSFVQDWKENHSGGYAQDGTERDKKYLKFMHVARTMYKVHRIKLDVEQVLDNVSQLLYSRGWQLYNEEVEQMRQDLTLIKNEIERR